MNKPHWRDANLPSKNRVEALVDGIFSVSMTLLVLDIKLPEGLQLASNEDMLRHFASVEFSFGIYFASFCVLAMFWIAHHFQFKYVVRVDPALLWINLIFLLLTTLVPFSTNLIANHGTLQVPVILYATNVLLLFMMLALHVRRMRLHRELTTAEFTEAIGDSISRRLRSYCVIPVSAMIVALFSPAWASRMFYLLAVLHFVPEWMDRALAAFEPKAKDRKTD